MKAWYERVRLWSQTNLTEDDAGKKDIGFWKEYWRTNGIQGVIINCSGIVTYYQSQRKNPILCVQGNTKARFLGDEDCFGLWNQAAREAGLSVVARMDMNVTDKPLTEVHPEWYCRDKDGAFILSQGRYVTCIHGGYYREYIPAVFQEVIETYAPDGFADNNWSGLKRDTICYCSSCRQKFREAYQEELPEAHDWKDPVYRKWVRWGYESRIRLWEFLNHVTSRYGGADCLWIGMLNADPIQTRGQFYDVRELVKRSKIVFLDNQSREEDGGFEQNSVFGNLIHAIAGEETVVAESMSQYYRGIRAFRLSSALAGEARTWSFTGISAGISPWFHFVGAGVQDARKFKISEDILSWYQENLSVLTNRKNMAEVALLWNQETFIYYGQSDVKERCVYPWQGFAKVLSQKGVPFLPLHTSEIERFREQIKVYIIPDVAVMTEDEINILEEEWKAGKNFVISGTSGRYGAYGEKREKNPLLQIFGIEDCGEEVGCKETGSSDWSYDDSHNYLRIAAKQHEMMQVFTDTQILPFGGSVQLIKEGARLEKLLTYIPSFPIYPPEFAWIGEETEIGGIFAGEDNQARVIYMAADIDRCYSKYQIPDHKELLYHVVKWAAHGKELITLKAEGDVCCNVYSQNNKLLIHLVNLTGGNTALGTMSHPIAIHDLVLEAGIDKPVSGVRGLVEKSRYAYETLTDQLRIQIPELREHELLIIDLDT